MFNENITFLKNI